MRPFAVKFHVPQRTLDSLWEQRQIYGRIGVALEPFGGRFEFVLHHRDTARAQIEADRDFHILERGTVQHPRALNSGPAYIAPYQYLDPVGTRFLSSIGHMEFDPGKVDLAAAQKFQASLFVRYAITRRSRYEQPQQTTNIPQGCIAVFLQTESHRGVGEALYVTMRQMIKALLARDDPRAIVVKPHPMDLNFDTLAWLVQKSRKDKRMHILPANIHDILAAASVVVTINSAVGIEAMIHGRPVITCGQADFHHATEVVRDRDGFDTAIARAEARVWPHAQYLYWFFKRNCIDVTSPTLGADVMAKITATGYFDALG